MQTHLDIAETDGSFDETEIESQANLSCSFHFVPCLKQKYMVVT